MRHIDAADILLRGAAKAAHNALVQVHADAHEFVLHLDIDVIAQEDFLAVNVPGSGGLGLDDVRTAFIEFAKHKHLLGLDVAQYNPDKDPDGSGAGKLVDLMVEALSVRLEALTAPPEAETREADAATASSGDPA
jgi:arginase